MQVRRFYKHFDRQQKKPRPPMVEHDGKLRLPVCGRKYCYDKRTAIEVKRRILAGQGVFLNMYSHHCGYWHLTKQHRGRQPTITKEKNKFTIKPDKL